MKLQVKLIRMGAIMHAYSMGYGMWRRALVAAMAMFVVAVAVPGCGGGHMSPAQHIEKGKDYLDKGARAAAIIEFKNALQEDPDNPEARWLLGKTYVEDGLGAQGEEQLNRAKKLGVSEDAVRVLLLKASLLQAKYAQVLADTATISSSDPGESAEIHALRGDAFLGRNEVKAADREFDIALKLKSTLTRAQLGKARVAMSNGKDKDARRWVDEALRDAPKSGRAWGVSGRLYLIVGEAKKAEDAYTKAIELSNDKIEYLFHRALVRVTRKDYKQAQQDIKEMKRLSAPPVPVYFAEGIVQFSEKKYANAQGSFEQAVSHDPNYMPAVFYLGATHYLEGNLGQAGQYLGQYHARVPQATGATILLGLTQLRQRDYAGAVSVLKPVLQKEPDNVLVLNALANATIAQGRVQEAVTYMQRAAKLKPKSAERRYQLGIGLLLHGQQNEAAQQLQTAVELNPELWQANLALVLGPLSERDYAKAVQVAEKWTRREPSNPVAFNILGVARTAAGDDGGARKALGQALKLSPNNPVYAHNLAALEIKQGRPQQAIAEYRQVLEAHPSDLRTLLSLAGLEQAMGKPEDAERDFQRAVKAHPQALAAYVALARFYRTQNQPSKALSTLNGIRGAKSSPEFLREYGQDQLAAGDAAGAVATLRQLRDAAPASAEAHFLLAKALGFSNDMDGMRRELKAALARNPEYSQAQLARARLALVDRDLAEAQRVISALKARKPSNPDVLELQGLLALIQKRPAEAVKAYRRALAVNPSGGRVVTLGKVQWQAGDRQGSLTTLQRWLDKHPKDAFVRFYLATLYVALGRQADAESAFARVIDEMPDNIAALNNLAWLLRQRQPDKALDLAQKARKLAPENPAVMDTLAMLLLDKGEASKSVELLEAAVKKVPGDPTLKYHLALAFEKSGARAEAQKAVEQALAESGHFAERNQAMALARRLKQQ
ncbi:MAG: PEP-CTERM system TPR-repeat protein PrsT [Gammaproteobacteria bacterium]